MTYEPTESLPNGYRIFFSHGDDDAHIVDAYLKQDVMRLGAHVFVDVGEINYGDDFHGRILQELAACDELLVLFTPSSLKRPWVFAELGAMLVLGKRIVPILYGATQEDLRRLGILSLLGTRNLLNMNDFPDYLRQLAIRVREH
jgi:hypothetical protein